MDPRKISIADFSYELPDGRIAHYPLPERDGSRLLIYERGAVREDFYRNISDYLPAHSLLVFNNTKVVEARLVFQKPSGGQIEIFCLEPGPGYPDITTAMSSAGSVRWKCLIGGASKWKAGQVLSLRIPPPAGLPEKASVFSVESPGQQEKGAAKQEILLEAFYLGKLEDSFLIELKWSPSSLPFAGLLHHAGLMPLPPYIRRPAEDSDAERYQTVYARHDGSVAAPTAGLHFTEAIFHALASRSIDKTFVTLHVGAGTFKPIKSSSLGEHIMHSEFIEVAAETVEELLNRLAEQGPGTGAAGVAGATGAAAAGAAGADKKAGGEKARGLIIPVGTTSLRTIESLYWLGVKTWRRPDMEAEELFVGQWDAYDRTVFDTDEGEQREREGGINIKPSAGEALRSLLDWMRMRNMQRLLTRTQLLITPGYEWKIAGALVTNFHQPGSTLLLLVAALIGEDWRKVYGYAMENGFRFLSYGDGSLLFRSIGETGGATG